MGDSVNIAAIDIGSNAIRMAISTWQDGVLHPVERLRTPIRLGKDVFGTGKISKDNISAVSETFQFYQQLIDDHEVSMVRATATSAAREAKNQLQFVTHVRNESGIAIEVIEAQEEARLIQKAVEQKLNLENRNALIMDIGGGSVEFIALSNREIQGIQSFKMGTVRALKACERSGDSIKSFIYSFGNELESFIKSHLESVDVIIGTGGNIESMGRLRCSLFTKRNPHRIRRKEVTELMRSMMPLSAKEREVAFNLRKDRVDVILPALRTVKLLMKSTNLDLLEIPRVGLRDGITLDLLDQWQKNPKSYRK